MPMSRSTKRVLLWALILVGFLALLNPGYRSAYVDGPNGVVQTQQFSFGPGSFVVFTRVVADESTVSIDHR
jgi:hypothetical protein